MQDCLDTVDCAFMDITQEIIWTLNKTYVKSQGVSIQEAVIPIQGSYTFLYLRFQDFPGPSKVKFKDRFNEFTNF